MDKMDKVEQVAREARNDYLREWRRNHPEAVKEQRERYWIKRALKIMEDQEREDKDGNE